MLKERYCIQAFYDKKKNFEEKKFLLSSKFTFSLIIFSISLEYINEIIIFIIVYNCLILIIYFSLFH
jgi:hypothetical protein